MKDMLMRALDTAQKRGATYADARYVETEVQTILVRNGVLLVVPSTLDSGCLTINKGRCNNSVTYVICAISVKGQTHGEGSCRV